MEFAGWENIPHCGSDDSLNLKVGFHKLIHYRIFNDTQGKMNQNVQQCHGCVLLVPQFTLVAETQKGLRPSFSNGAAPPLGAQLFQDLIDIANQSPVACQFGVFGADMQVALVNDGPVTFILHHSP